MKIDYMKINGFGKLKDKFLKFEDGINVIYGENEAGKSTIVKFILSMFYGVSKGMRGKEISDYDRYLPLNTDEYSGKIDYIINNETYEVFRDFKKKMPVIYDKNGNDITRNFSINKSKESEYFQEQSGIDYNTFINSAVVEQQNIKIDKTDVNSLIQKISNMVETGDDNISFRKSMEKLDKMHLENVGTSKTKNRPINNVKNLIIDLTEEKRSLLKYKNEIIENNKQKNKLYEDLELSNNQKLLIKDIKKYYETFKVREIECQYESNTVQDLTSKIESVKEKKKNIDKLNDKKTKYSINNIIAVTLFIIAIVMFIFLNNKFLSIIPAIFLIMDLIYISNKKKNMKTLKNDEKLKINNEYNELVEEYNVKQNKLNNLESSLKEQKIVYKNNLLFQYKDYFEIDYIKEMFNNTAEQLDSVYEDVELDIKNISIQIKLLENDKENIDSKLERLTVIEEKLENLKIEEDELNELDISYNLAKECLNLAYDNIKNNLSPKFEEKLCEIVKETTNCEYENVFFNTENVLCVELKNGSYLPISRLSTGTIDEIYFSLRLSALDEIDKEKMVIIFDDSFVYFDDERMEKAISYLQNNNYLNQIFIFTCSHREENCLKKLSIDYNLIYLEK